MELYYSLFLFLIFFSLFADEKEDHKIENNDNQAKKFSESSTIKVKAKKEKNFASEGITTSGLNASHVIVDKLFGLETTNTFGIQIRRDYIHIYP